MRWDRSHRSPNLEDRRGEGPARGGVGGGFGGLGILALLSRFGWKGILIGLLLAGLMTYGGGSSLCTGGEAPSSRQAPVEGREQGAVRPGSEDELVRFVGFVFDDVQSTWRKQLGDYRDARMVVFRDAVRSACGTTSSAVGPFYCPLDQRVYIDLAFYRDLTRRFGAPGDFAQAYVIAHEVGHHLQRQAGVLGGGGGRRESIQTELQADCLAGAWARSAETRGLLEVGDVDEALAAAAAIGDDRIQEQTQGQITPETWTHGSAEQRSAAWKKGYRGGSAATCGL